MENAENKTVPLFEDCPCTAQCGRHGNCVACIGHHLPRGSMVTCMRQLVTKLDAEGKLEALLKPQQK